MSQNTTAMTRGGVQALSAAPARPTVEQVEDEVSMGHGAWDMVDPQELIGAVLRLAASPTPPAEQPAITSESGAVYAELPEEHWLSTNTTIVWNEDSMRDFADRTHALRMEQAAPKAAPGVGNSGFDHQTAADFLNNKTVSDEAVRKFVQASRWAHDERAALSAMLISVRGELASREAEIALLKKALMDAESAPQQEAQEPVAWLNPWRADQVTTDYDAYGERGIPLYTAPKPAPLSDDAKDAARYRWLREGNDAKHGAAWHVAVNLYGCEWDAAIDAALAAQGGSNGL